ELARAPGPWSCGIATTWSSELVTVTAPEPAGVVTVAQSTVVTWRDGSNVSHTATPAPRTSTVEVQAEIVAVPAEEAVPITDLVGADARARKPAEWFDLAFRWP